MAFDMKLFMNATLGKAEQEWMVAHITELQELVDVTVAFYKERAMNMNASPCAATLMLPIFVWQVCTMISKPPKTFELMHILAEALNELADQLEKKHKAGATDESRPE